MLALTKEYITDLYYLVDELLPKGLPKNNLGGRPLSLIPAEVVTLLLWNTLTVRSKTLKDAHAWAQMYHADDFPTLPKYKAFVHLCHQAGPNMLHVLQSLLASNSPLVFVDSTMLQVCKLVRADSHKVAANIADFGKNHQGWHYGFKLHASINPKNQLCGFALTPASIYDAQKLPNLINHNTRVAVGDSHYGASVMRAAVWKKFGTLVVAPPHFKQKKKLITWWQHKLLTMRPKIESVFDYLKEHLHLVTSFPRSVSGYLIHYLRILLAYQIMHF
jgi:hypothetical protein